MKTTLKFQIAILIACIFFKNIPSGFGQDKSSKEQKNFSVSMNFLPLLFQSFNGFVEFRLNQSSSLAAGFNYWSTKKGSLIYNKNDQNYKSITLEYRYFPSQNSMEGIYLAPWLKYRNINQKQVINFAEDANGSSSIALPAQNQLYHQAGSGLNIGFQKIIYDPILVGGFIGFGYYPFEKIEATNQDWISEKDRFSRIDFRLGLTFGMAFQPF
jgi:hypothetical protein